MVPGEHITILNLTVFIAYFLRQKQFISYPSGYMENWSPHGKKKTIAIFPPEFGTLLLAETVRWTNPGVFHLLSNRTDFPETFVNG